MPEKIEGERAEAASLACKMGSAVVDTITLMAELGEELPVIKPVLKTLKTVREKVDTVKNNREELASLRERCIYITACFIVKLRQSPSWGAKVRLLEQCLKGAEDLVGRCSQRGKFSRMVNASRDKDEIAGLNARVDRLTADFGLSGIASVLGEVAELKELMVSFLEDLRALVLL